MAMGRSLLGAVDIIVILTMAQSIRVDRGSLGAVFER